LKGQVGQFKPQGFIPGISLFDLILRTIWNSGSDEFIPEIRRSPIGNQRWILKNLLHPRILDHGSPMFLYDGGDTRQLGII